MALAEIGRYTGVDRLATWENHLDGVTYGCTNEWCNDGIEPAIDYLILKREKLRFDMLKKTNLYLDPFITQMLEVQGVRPSLSFPVTIGVDFLSFNFWQAMGKKMWN